MRIFKKMIFWLVLKPEINYKVMINYPSEGVTFSFRCQQGVKQGCLLNPLSFGLYMDALEGCLDSRECDASALANMHVWLFFFVDDFVLTSELEVGL
jgi:hypothetical protein